ncbi:hypothetical protein [Isoptericola hypogeus]|uniref:hypothetical protein n=1 Tax=Isoptericola hypogeus TaxID=300179 RepID=UPI0031D6619E
MTTWLVAFGLVVTGAVAPAAATEDGELSMSLSLARERWWQGQVVTVDVLVTDGGIPIPTDRNATLRGWLDGRSFSLRQVEEGRVAVDLPAVKFAPGDHVVRFQYRDIWANTVLAEASVVFHVDQLETAVLAPQRWVHGDATNVQFDLTGTDLQQEGTVELATRAPGGTPFARAELADGVASFDLTGTEAPVRWYVYATQRDAATGEIISRWALGSPAAPKPTTLNATIPASWQHGAPFDLVVEATSDRGTPDGYVEASYEVDGDADPERRLARGTLADGRTTLSVDPAQMPAGAHRVVVRLTSPTFEAPVVVRDVAVKPERATAVSVSTARTWTYGTSRRVQVTVSASGAKPQGRVDLISASKGKIGSAKVTYGTASFLVSGTKLPPHSARNLTATFVPSAPTDAASKRTWKQRVDKAKPKVTLTMKDRMFRAGANLGKSEPGTVRVRTAGMPEHGRLVLETRSPRAKHDGWRTRSHVDWRLTRADAGVQRVTIPAPFLRTADGRPGKVYLRVRYVPTDTRHVATVVSDRVTIRRY